MAVTLILQAMLQWIDNHPSFASALLLLGAWLCWRLWRFTVLPAFRPDDPKELPYLIPCKGS